MKILAEIEPKKFLGEKVAPGCAIKTRDDLQLYLVTYMQNDRKQSRPSPKSIS